MISYSGPGNAFKMQVMLSEKGEIGNITIQSASLAGESLMGEVNISQRPQACQTPAVYKHQL